MRDFESETSNIQVLPSGIFKTMGFYEYDLVNINKEKEKAKKTFLRRALDFLPKKYCHLTQNQNVKVLEMSKLFPLGCSFSFSYV